MHDEFCPDSNFTKSEIRELTEILNRRQVFIEQKIDHTVSGQGKRIKKLMIPTELLQMLRRMEQDVVTVAEKAFPESIEAQLFAEFFKLMISGQIAHIEGQLEEVYREVEAKKHYRKRPLEGSPLGSSNTVIMNANATGAVRPGYY